MADVDVTKVEQPDELIQLAWNAGLDKKAVIREGTDAARQLLAGERNAFVTLFWPVPRPLEAVSVWSENPRAPGGVGAGLRPFASAVIPSCILGAIITQLVVVPRVSPGEVVIAMTLGIAATFAVIGGLLKLVIGAILKRRVSRLDEEAAFATVLAELRRGMTRNPERIPLVCTWIRRGLQLPAVSNQL